MNTHVPSGDPPPLRLLVADDDRDGAALLAMFMRGEGHRVHLAYDGETALAMALCLRPDVAILDLGMPGMDGLSVARQLRTELTGTRMLLLAVTGRGEVEDQMQTRAAGFDHHFVKPANPVDLRACIADWCQRNGMMPHVASKG